MTPDAAWRRSERKCGVVVSYTFYGRAEQAKVIRTSRSGDILFLDNGRWMHLESCTFVKVATC